MPRILITGIGGFVGTHLAKSLLVNDHSVGGLLFPGESTKQLEPFLNKLTLFQGDITQKDAVKAVLGDFQPEVIFHLAALAPVSQSFSDPIRYQQVNYEGTILVAEIARYLSLPLENFVFASSSEIYGPQTKKSLFRESDLPQPNNPYAISKFAAEKYLQMLKRVNDFPMVILRFCNTYGRKSGLYVVEYFIKQALKGERIVVKSPNSFRDFLHIHDHTKAYSALLKEPLSDLYNIGTGNPISMISLANKIVSLLDSDSEVVIDTASEKGQRSPEYISLDSQKARQELKWKPKITLEEGIQLTAEKISCLE
ncbi:MAG: NAD-dependent epimerase/dehydratase family protein [Candidatus Hodarchaeota archaeon]